jgi:hypothetical protein
MNGTSVVRLTGRRVSESEELADPEPAEASSSTFRFWAEAGSDLTRFASGLSSSDDDDDILTGFNERRSTKSVDITAL